LELARQADRIVAARGKKVVVYDLRRDPPDEETLLGVLLGPSGNLRAPTIRKGKTLLVGYNENAYQDELG
jgi:arsenate reductase-like glutaredoxin family protein